MKELEALLTQAEALRDNIARVQEQSLKTGYNAEGIRDCALTLKTCIKKVGNNKMAALAARDKRKVYADMEDAIDQLIELTTL